MYYIGSESGQSAAGVRRKRICWWQEPLEVSILHQLYQGLYCLVQLIYLMMVKALRYFLTIARIA
jgi:hypothetical protein